VTGEPPAGGWRVGVGNPYEPDQLLAVVALTDHGIATRLIRRWSVGGAPRHHLLDPCTGDSLETGLDSVTVVARDAWIAEILTKAAFVAGPSEAMGLITARGGAGLLVESPDRIVAAGEFAAFFAAPDRAPVLCGATQ